MFLDRLRRMFAPEPAWNAGQAAVYEAGLRLMALAEKHYRRHLSGVFRAGVRDEGIFRARVFGFHFATSAMTLAWGRERHTESETVYRALVEQARQDVRLGAEAAMKKAVEIWDEQRRALTAEKNNVGSGHLALASLYEAALEISAGPLWKMPAGKAAQMPQLLGSVVAEMLGAWAELYAGQSSGPMQTYTLGFDKSVRDEKPWREDA